MRRKTARQRVELPDLDYHGPWPKPFTAPPHFTHDETIGFYMREAVAARCEAAEQRARRLDLEQELDAATVDFLNRPPPEIRYVERKVYTPMPPREVVRRGFVTREEPLRGSIIVTPEPEPRRTLRQWFADLWTRPERNIHIGMGF